MVVVETTLSQLQKLTDSKITVEELEEVLFQIGFEVDEVEGDELKIDITPDRLDAISPVGLARIIKNYTSSVFLPNQYEVYPSEYEVKVEKSVSKVRPFTACAVIKGLHISDEQLKEIIWVQEKLHATFGKKRKKAAIGIYPLKQITWPITYKALAPDKISFRPLLAETELSAKKIIEEHPTGKEYGHLLENESVYPLFVDANNVVLSLPPIINSHELGKVEVGESEVFLECSGFDLHALQTLLQNLCSLFCDIGGQIHMVKVTYDGESYEMPKMQPEVRPLAIEDVTKRSGIAISSHEMKTCLEKMGHAVKVLFEDTLEVAVPPYRSDIWHDVDVIDDVVRGYGINNLEPLVPELTTQGSMLPINRFESDLTDLLVGLGFNEIKTLAVTDKDDQFIKMNVDVKKAQYIQLGSTADKSINMLRTSLLPENLKLLMHNRSAPLPQKVFEVGHVILPNKEQDVRSVNESRICISIAKDPATVTDIKQVVESLCESLGIAFTYEAITHTSFVEGRVATIKLGKETVGIIGEVHPQVLTNWNLTTPVCTAEFSVTKLLNRLREE